MNKDLYNDNDYQAKTARLSPVVGVQIKPFLSSVLEWDSSHASLLIPSLLQRAADRVLGKATVTVVGQKMRTRANHGNGSHVLLATINVA